jgi:hypothetical protein
VFYNKRKYYFWLVPSKNPCLVEVKHNYTISQVSLANIAHSIICVTCYIMYHNSYTYLSNVYTCIQYSYTCMSCKSTKAHTNETALHQKDSKQRRLKLSGGEAYHTSTQLSPVYNTLQVHEASGTSRVRHWQLIFRFYTDHIYKKNCNTFTIMNNNKQLIISLRLCQYICFKLHVHTCQACALYIHVYNILYIDISNAVTKLYLNTNLLKSWDKEKV